MEKKLLTDAFGSLAVARLDSHRYAVSATDAWRYNFGAFPRAETFCLPYQAFQKSRLFYTADPGNNLALLKTSIPKVLLGLSLPHYSFC